MEAIQMISLYNTLFFVSLGLTALSLGLGVFFFFYFDIPTIHAFLTGKAKKETIERMAEQNSRTGKLRFGHESGDIKRGRTGKMSRSGKLGVTTGDLNPAVQHPSAVHTESFSGYAQSAAPLQVFETAVLKDDDQQTTVLRGDMAETSVLSAGEAGATSVLSAADDAGATSVLRERKATIRFDVVENTLVIHTDEHI